MAMLLERMSDAQRAHPGRASASEPHGDGEPAQRAGWGRSPRNSMSRIIAVRLRIGERGASVVEYSLLVALIAVVSVVAVEFFGASTGSSLSRSNGSMFVP